MRIVFVRIEYDPNFGDILQCMVFTREMCVSSIYVYIHICIYIYIYIQRVHFQLCTDSQINALFVGHHC